MGVAFIRKVWKDRIVQYPGRRQLQKADSSTEQVTVYRDEGTITEVGDGFNKDNMNDLEGRIGTAFDAVPTFTEVTGGLLAGNTTLQLASESITTSSTIDIFTDTYGVNPVSVTVATGSITLVFEAQPVGIQVKVRVW